jgi:DNA helicase-2/ATP-dependent DNA helicase PcrA
VVQGVAGSGKTAVALHRIAWLLYRYRNDGLSYENLLLFTPTGLLSNISGVLPSWGSKTWS